MCCVFKVCSHIDGVSYPLLRRTFVLIVTFSASDFVRIIIGICFFKTVGLKACNQDTDFVKKLDLKGTRCSCH